MKRGADTMTGDLFAGDLPVENPVEGLAEGAVVLRGRVRSEAASILNLVNQVAELAPFRHMVTPGGHSMSVSMTNCGAVGWVTDLNGYRYAAADPETGQPWPPMPEAIREMATSAAEEAGFPGFVPDACLINRYEPGAKMGLHQDKNQRDYKAPIVSVSLGLPATFLFGGLDRTDPTQRVRLESGDVVVWGGPARLAYHGIAPLADGLHPLTGRCRINLTFRRAL